MARRGRKARKAKLLYTVLTLIIALAVALVGYFFADEIAGFIEAPDGTETGGDGGASPDGGSDGDAPLVGGP